MQPEDEDVDEDLPSTPMTLRADAPESPPPRASHTLTASMALRSTFLNEPLFPTEVRQSYSKHGGISIPRSAKL